MLASQRTSTRHRRSILGPKLAKLGDEFDLFLGISLLDPLAVDAHHHLDASVSEIVMRFLLDCADTADDMSKALRSMLYSYHEDTVRHVCDLPALLDERESRDLMIMVFELEKRSGNYSDRIRAICQRAGTF